MIIPCAAQQFLGVRRTLPEGWRLSRVGIFRSGWRASAVKAGNGPAIQENASGKKKARIDDYRRYGGGQ
jgi:hypothetical protein